jgi:hypothetical protein
MNDYSIGSPICLSCVDHYLVSVSSNVSVLLMLIHPLTTRQQVVKGQLDRDKSLMELMGSMQELYAFVDTVKAVPQKIDRLENVIFMILRQTVECVVFVREYSGHGFAGKTPADFILIKLRLLNHRTGPQANAVGPC